MPHLSEGACVTWGNFDGVHLGHQKLLNHVVTSAHQQGSASVVITFYPHPLQVVGTTPPIITCMHTKLELIADMGLDFAVVLPFTNELAALEPEDFVHKVLAGPLNTKKIIMGYSSFFGKGRRGSATLLSNMGKSLNFSVEQLPPVLFGGSVVSSTRVRKLIAEGNVKLVAPLLGRNHFVEGYVVRGRGLGRQLGFPTLNVHPGLYPTNMSVFGDEQKLQDDPGEGGGMIPCPGVYAAYTEVAGKLLPSVVSIGTNPTFEHTHGKLNQTLESHILDFNRDIYGQNVRIHFKSFLRPTSRFNTPAQLIAQIKLDVQKAREIL